MTIPLDKVAEAMERAGVTGLDPAAVASFLARRAGEPFTKWRPLPTGEQKDFVRDAIRADASGVCVLRGGNRSGKTDSGAYVTAFRARQTLDAIARLRKAEGKPTVIWCVGTTYEHCGNTMWTEKLRALIPDQYIKNVTWLNRGAGHPKMVRLHSGVDLVFKSADQGRESMQAAGLFGVWVDEQVPGDIFSELRMRCIDNGALLWWTFTPLIPDPNLEQAINDPPPMWRFYQIDMEDNRVSRGGYLADEEVDLALAQLKAQNPDEYETRKSGALMATEGLIFKNFRRQVHVRPAAEIADAIARPNIVFRGCGVDFGRTVPHCTLWGARDDNGRWYIYAQHYRAEWTIERHAEAMRSINDQFGHEPDWHACDPGDGSKSSLGDEIVVSGRKYLRQNGFVVINAVKRWSESIRTIQRLLAPEIVSGTDGPVAGEPMLYISDECTDLAREIGMYRRVASTKISDRDGPLKKDDHSVDALRYLIETYESRYAGSKRTAAPSVTHRRAVGNPFMRGVG
jgi:phage terminase large subunit-like protein